MFDFRKLQLQEKNECQGAILDSIFNIISQQYFRFPDFPDVVCLFSVRYKENDNSIVWITEIDDLVITHDLNIDEGRIEFYRVYKMIADRYTFHEILHDGDFSFPQYVRIRKIPRKDDSKEYCKYQIIETFLDNDIYGFDHFAMHH
jgi:hypothetical protein